MRAGAGSIIHREVKIMNASNLFGKKVVSVTGKSGYVLGVRVSGRKIECLECADEDENEFLIDCALIKRWGESIIFYDRQGEIAESKPLKLGLPSFDEDGKYLGELSDFRVLNGKLVKAKIGKKNYPAESVVLGDAAIVKRVRTVQSDVIKDGKVIIKRGTPLSEESLKLAESLGEYVQTNLKSIK